MKNLEQAPVLMGLAKRVKKNLIFVILLVLIALFAITAFYYRSQLNKLKEDPGAVATKEMNQLVEDISKHMVLPEDEEPTVATVNNPENLQNQPFFSGAKKGDKVLIYTNSRKAILYDPVLDRILEVAPLTVGAPTPETTGEALPEVTVE